MDITNKDNDFQESLMQHLKSRYLGEKQLIHISNQLADAGNAGFYWKDWHIVGQPPPFELVIEGSIDAGNIGAFSEVLNHGVWTEFTVFNKGTLPPDRLDAKITVQISHS